MVDRGNTAVRTAAESDKATETLSQFVARVLNQLSLSAWLPAAALVLLLTFVAELGAALDRSEKERQANPPTIQALNSIAGISLGGALLLVSAIVILTMVTQAFSFEAIRVLEGYWGTNRLIERVAGWRCSRHRRTRQKLERRLAALTERAWIGAQQEIQRINDDLSNRGAQSGLSPAVIEALRVRVLGKRRHVDLSETEKKDLERIYPQWQQWAPAEVLRRRVNVQKRLRDYPRSVRVLPTRLGNILRRHEDEARVLDVETFVQRVFDDLPLSLKIEHDEQRTRLDLYCSMVFVLAFITIVALSRLIMYHMSYVLSALLFGVMSMTLMYRAGMASARAYGGLLLLLAQQARERQNKPAGENGSPTSE